MSQQMLFLLLLQLSFSESLLPSWHWSSYTSLEAHSCRTKVKSIVLARNVELLGHPGEKLYR